jgi:hypothetical protein
MRGKWQDLSLGVKSNPNGSLIEEGVISKPSYRDVAINLSTLYGGHERLSDAEKNVLRKMQMRSGSNTILLGGKLLGRAIIRGAQHPVYKSSHHALSRQNVQAWLKAYQHDWRAEGFDYNPIEPILKNKQGKFRIHKNKDGTYRVSAGVINAPSFEIWSNWSNSSIARQDAVEQKARLGKIFNRLRIEHGHLWAGNFLVQEKEIRGKTRIRLFVIDFDMARIVRFGKVSNAVEMDII